MLTSPKKTPSSSPVRRRHNAFPLVLEVLGTISEFLDSQSLLVVSQTCKRWRSVALYLFPLDSRSYFRKDWVEDSIELALPSNVLAISISADESHMYVCARGYEPTDTTILYIHDIVSGQRSFEDLPPAFSEDLAEVWFEGPHYLVCGTRCEANAIFDCERGLELRLLSGGRNFRTSADGRHIGALFSPADDQEEGARRQQQIRPSASATQQRTSTENASGHEDVFVVQLMGPKQRQCAVDATQLLWKSDTRRQEFERSLYRSRAPVTSPSSPATIIKMQMLFCPYYEVSSFGHMDSNNDNIDDSKRLAVLTIPSSVTTIGDTSCDCFVGGLMLVTVTKNLGDAQVQVVAYFPSTSYVGARVDEPMTRSDATYSTRLMHITAHSNLKCTVMDNGVERGSTEHGDGVSRAVLLFDVGAMNTYIWYPLTGALLAMGQQAAPLRTLRSSTLSLSESSPVPGVAGDPIGTLPSTTDAGSGDDHSSVRPVHPHPTTFAAPTVECEGFFVLMPKRKHLPSRHDDADGEEYEHDPPSMGGVSQPVLAGVTPSTVLAFLSVERSGLGGGEKRQYYLNFISLDTSLRTKLILKGKSLLAALPSSAEVIVALWTASTAPPHPLFEATECGIGAVIKFGRAMLDEEKQRSRGLATTSRRMVWAIWASVVVMGLSFVTTVLTLVYNGWWLHMQFLFTAATAETAVGMTD